VWFYGSVRTALIDIPGTVLARALFLTLPKKITLPYALLWERILSILLFGLLM
jgi:hypothetical protein